MNDKKSKQQCPMLLFLDTVGVWLQEPVFTHGQLYVAASRISNPNNLHFAVRKTAVKCTRNVVFKEALL